MTVRPSTPPPTPRAAAPLADWGHETDDVHAGGLEQVRTATEAERAALASALGIVAAEAVQLRYRLTRAPDEGYRLKGRLIAEVAQACVITLQAVHETVDVDIKVEFRPPEELAEAASGPVDLDDETEFEPIEGHWLAIGRVVFEEIAANLNPYPRRPGAEYAPAAGAADADEKAANPFAVLEKLRKAPPDETA